MVRAAARELRGLSDQELAERLQELKQELFNLRFQRATGRLDNYRRIREVKKEIARVLTVKRERELGIEPIPRSEGPAKKRRRLFRRRDDSAEREERAEDEERSSDESLTEANDEPEENATEGSSGDN